MQQREFLQHVENELINRKQLFACYDSETAHVELPELKDSGKPYTCDNTILCIFSINGKVITFRYIKDFMLFLKDLEEVLSHKYVKTSSGVKWNGKRKHVRRLIIWVHNLKYDIWALLMPLNKYFKINNDETMIIKAQFVRLVAGCFEFRDSLKLTGLSLEKSGIEYEIPEEFRKKTGDWDYTKVRTQSTVISPEEMGYAVNDVLALEHIIRNLMKLHDIKKIKNLPPTKTGFVRRHVKKEVKDDGEYQDRMNFKLTDESNYLAKRAYHGGISDIPLQLDRHYAKGSIGDFDMTSQYPFVLCTQIYPCGDSIIDNAKTMDDLDELVNEGWGFFADCVIDEISIKYDMISPLLTNDWYKIYDKDPRNVFYGSRVYRSFTPFKHTVTSVEYTELKKYFNLKLRVIYCERFHLKRLPRKFISTILDAYAQKTVYKGDKNNVTKYKMAKIVVNSIYGICGTCPIQDEKTLDLNTWEIREMTPEEINHKLQLHKPKPPFVDYRWAPYCTSWARHFLSMGLFEAGKDAIYCDTDSVKFRNPNHIHDKFFINENKEMIQMLHDAAHELHLTYESFAPKDNKNRPRPLGVWDPDSYDGEMYAKAPKDNHKLKIHDDGSTELVITSSGINQKHLLNFYVNGLGLTNPRDQFNYYKQHSKRMLIPSEFSGKLTHEVADSRKYLGMAYTGYDGTKGFIQVAFSDTLSPQPFEKTEKIINNLGYTAMLEYLNDKLNMYNSDNYVDDLESEGYDE